MKKDYLTKIFLSSIVLSLAFSACTSSRESSSAPSINANAETSRNSSHENANSEANDLTDEKAKPEKEKQKLEADKAKLSQEKKEAETVKNATPPDVDIENWNGRDWTIPKPPSNVRTAPDGKILCTITKKDVINLRGTSNIKDKNGEWLYTDYCGKIGFIHSSQVQFIDGEPAG